MNDGHHQRPTGDDQLLQAYIDHGDESAFRTLVERHAAMVFATALRRTGQRQLAEEATQNVFQKLAIKGPNLSAGVVVAGWLHNAARFEAATLQRTESNRMKKMHQAADNLADQRRTESPPDPEAWAELSPFIDDALGELATADRDVVILRFYQGKTYLEIGNALGKTESSARKHTNRALDSLASLLRKHGITHSTLTIGTAVSFGFSAGAPHGFATALATSFTFPAAPATAALTSSASIASTLPFIATVALVCATAPVAIQWHLQSQPTPHEPIQAAVQTVHLQDHSPLSANPDTTSLDLDTVFAARGAHRLRLLAQWLPGASENDVRTADERLAQTESHLASLSRTHLSNHNIDLARSAIFTRWTELEPTGLIAYVRTSAAPRSIGPPDSRLLWLAYNTWAKTDPTAALAAAANESPEIQSAVISAFQDSQPEQAILAASTLPVSTQRFGFNWQNMFAKLAESDLAAAAKHARALTESSIQQRALAGTLGVWARRDPQAALEFAASLEGFQAKAAARDTVVNSVIDTDPTAAISLVDDLPTGLSRTTSIRSLARQLALADPAQATVWLETLTSPQDRRSALAGLALAYSKTDPQAALATFAQLGWDFHGPENVTTYSPGRSQRGDPRAADSLPAAATAVIGNLAKSDPQQALHYAAQITASSGNDLFKKIATDWIGDSPASAMAFTTSLEPGTLRNQLAPHIASTLGATDPDAAMQWATGLGGTAGANATVAVFNILVDADPATAARSLADLPDIPEKQSTTRFLADTWVARDFDAALAWVQNHDAPDQIAPALRPVVEAWSTRDPEAAATWINTLPDSPAMQQAAIGLVGWMINQPEIDHPTAFSWATRITADRQAREFYFEHIARDWLKSEPAAAAEALATSDLPQHTKSRLLSRHGATQPPVAAP